MRAQLFGAVLILASSVHALAQGSSSAPATVAEEAAVLRELKKAQVDAVRRLPGTGMSVVEAGGKSYVMSDNGRFAIPLATSRVIDLWNGKVIRSAADAAEIANKVDLKMLGLNIDDLNTLTVGEGKKQVVAFVDPECPYCKQLMSQMGALGKSYSFKIVPLPLLGERSVKEVQALHCMKDQKQAAEILVSGDYASLEGADISCSGTRIQRSIVTSRVLGIDAVPYVITDQNVLHRGAVKDLRQFLESGVSGYEEVAKAGDGSK